MPLHLTQVLLGKNADGIREMGNIISTSKGLAITSVDYNGLSVVI